jgi:hypothetical protein
VHGAQHRVCSGAPFGGVVEMKSTYDGESPLTFEYIEVEDDHLWIAFQEEEFAWGLDKTSAARLLGEIYTWLKEKDNAKTKD